MKRVVATGTFDILHPGHVFYLEESKKLGDELHVIVARDANVKHKPRPVIPEEQRLMMVRALKTVDFARLGSEKDMFEPIEEIKPDIITIGFNQYFDTGKLKDQLNERGIYSEVVKINDYKGQGFSSSRSIMQQILKQRCNETLEK
ncbi:FAD synthase [Methanoplanus sp. FWC-SCC4]|uniref:FAD synthase n=1 Tax=Methanochimaera problematica TaxID=2609417 RepID=A0AA97I3H2_9EURY|nr:adenylyltransferase/cytidyltransferase family protein [Methanoplanus sp. FWC-SCC4]WOF16708.1 FAD synthase [Methanoplanus sp. FWC-SCC4]